MLVSTPVHRRVIHLILDMFLDLVGTSKGDFRGSRYRPWDEQGAPEKRERKRYPTAKEKEDESVHVQDVKCR